MSEFLIGNIEITRIIELEGPDFAPFEFFPDCTPEMLEPHLDWLQPRFLDPTNGKLVFAIQSYLLRTNHHTILIDSCVGEDKERARFPTWNLRKNTNYLAKLARAGTSPESIDYVLCTHLHADHVGWNTRLINGQWVPTFPNARYLFARDEQEFWQSKFAKDPHKYDDGCYQDSVLPVMDSGQALIVDQDHVLDDQIWLEPSPGHTPGHVSIRARSGDSEAVFSGDLMHSVLQCVYPELVSRACFDKPLARQTRLDFLERYCDRPVQVMTAHFPSPSSGHIHRHGGDGYRFEYFGEA
ncbi:MAG: hypothetical protein CFH37_00454 [Alphaproteobacteria bacterium MarineAlpha9_Bin7]|nr:MAG: hypothetical protein CFH37_00454 [Alphaproteobacteria bacterium MarineAlpha9_Bin7]